MTKYLNYLVSELLTFEDSELKDFLLEEAETYIAYWKKYSSDDSPNPFYNSTSKKFDGHTIHLPTGESIFISWDVDKLYEYAMSDFETIPLSLPDFDSLTVSDRANSASELERIDYLVHSIHEHVYTPILTMNFKPTNDFLILDGRHRYTEHKKFNPEGLLPVYILDDESCFTNITKKNAFLSYIILHNIEVWNELISGEDSEHRILNLKRCMN